MDNFQEIIDFIVNNESKKTVGMVLKRIEISLESAKKNKKHLDEREIEVLKSQVKEVIYEQYRNLRDFLQTGKILFINKNEESKEGEKYGK